MDCSVCWNLSHLWTAAWTGRLPVTQTPCALTCTSRVCFPAPPHTLALPGWRLTDHASLPSAEKRAGVFHLQAPSGPYGLNFSEAEAACGAQGAVLASLLQLSAAQQVCGAWESGAKPVGAFLSWALGLSLRFCRCSWASTSALLAGWPTARLPTPSSSPQQTVGTARWAWSAWAPGRTSRSAGTPTASACEVRPPPQAHALLPLSADPLTHCTAFPADVACRCRDGFVGDGTSVCNGKLLDVLATTANFSTFYGVPRGQGCGAAGILGEGTHREPTHNPVSHHPQMLLSYANATPRGLEFLDFLDDERTYKTLFVPVNEGFVDNMVTGSVGRAGPDPAF